jgi:hypothetical protein
MADQPDIRDVPSSWDYNLVLILATIFVGISIFVTYSRIEEINQKEMSLPGQKPVATITTPDGVEFDETGVLVRGFIDVVEIKLTEKDINDYREIKKYLEGATDVKMEIEKAYPYLKDDRNEFRVMGGLRDFTTYKNKALNAYADDKSITLDWYLTQSKDGAR